MDNEKKNSGDRMRPYICPSYSKKICGNCSCGTMKKRSDCGEGCLDRREKVLCDHIGKMTKPCIPYFEYLMRETLKGKK